MILAVGALASCNVFKEEMESTKPIAAPSVTISVSNVADYSFSFTIAPEGDAAYYSYLVVKADKAEALDSAAVYAVGIEGIVSGTVKYANEASKTIEVTDLESHCVYQVYAVAGSVGGNVGSISVKQVKTTDSTAPELEVDQYGSVVSYDALVDGSNAVVGFAFDEPVTLTDTATVFGSVYAINIFTTEEDGYEYLDEISNFVIPADSIVVMDNIMLVSIPKEEYIPGAFVAVSIMSGAVVNAAGIANSEDYFYNYLFTEQFEDENGGAYFRYEPVEFDLVSSVAKDSIVSYTDFSTVEIELTAKIPCPENNIAVRSKDKIKVSSVSANGKVVTYNLVKEAYDNATCVMTLGLDEDPEKGSKQSYTIPAGSVYDMWGNTSAALEIKNQLLRENAYLISDVTGTYDVTGASALNSAPISTTLTIAESNNPEKGNIMLTSFMGFPCQQNVYANFNVKTGIINIPDMQVMMSSKLTDNTPALLVFSVYGEGEDLSVNLQVSAPGVISDFDSIFGIYLFNAENYNGLGWYEAFGEFSATRQ